MKFLKVISLCVILALVGCSKKVKPSTPEDLKQPSPEAVSANDSRLPEFIIGAGDTIDIAVYRNDDMKRSIKIDSSGMIMLPLAGDIKASGKSVFQLRDEIKTRLAKYIIDPQVTISVSTTQSQKVIVLGEVRSPGIFTLDTDLTATEAISKAGGMTEDAKLEKVFLVRRGTGKTEGEILDLDSVLNGNTSKDVRLKNGDILYVPAYAIADVSWFFGHLNQILSPIVNLESGIVLYPQARDVIRGKDRATTPLSIPAR